MNSKYIVFLLIILINAKTVFNQTTTAASTSSPVATSTTTSAPTTSPATTTLASTTLASTTTTKAPSCPLPRPGVYCKDCRTLQSCATPGQEPEWTIACSVQNNAKPYCDNSTCSSINTCQQTEVPLEICQKIGRRPDPNDCTQFVECILSGSGTKLIGYTVKCPDGLRYSPTSKTCLASAACITAKQMCVGKAGRLVAYQPDPSIFIKCPDLNSNQRIFINYCKGQYKFDEKVANCQPQCTEEGNIPCNENCRAFYYCVKSGFTYKMEQNYCPPNFGFNPNTKVCDDQLGNCQNVGYSSKIDNRGGSDFENFFNSLFHPNN